MDRDMYGNKVLSLQLAYRILKVLQRFLDLSPLTRCIIFSFLHFISSPLRCFFPSFLCFFISFFHFAFLCCFAPLFPNFFVSFLNLFVKSFFHLFISSCIHSISSSLISS